MANTAGVGVGVGPAWAVGPLHPFPPCNFDAPAFLLVLVQMADAAGVDVGPVEVQPGLLVVPLLSWYTTAFDVEDPR